MFSDKALRCDCGYEVRASEENAAVAEIRRHASERHGIELGVELALELVRKVRMETERDGVAGKENQ